MDSFGKRLAAARERAGLTQTDLAKKIDSHATTVSKWERDELVATTEHREQLATALHVSFEWLAIGRGSMRRPAA